MLISDNLFSDGASIKMFLYLAILTLAVGLKYG
jgi:hypothetical protein